MSLISSLLYYLKKEEKKMLPSGCASSIQTLSFLTAAKLLLWYQFSRILAKELTNSIIVPLASILALTKFRVLVHELIDTNLLTDSMDLGKLILLQIS